jgi:hypothetical protein
MTLTFVACGNDESDSSSEGTGTTTNAGDTQAPPIDTQGGGGDDDCDDCGDCDDCDDSSGGNTGGNDDEFPVTLVSGWEGGWDEEDGFYANKVDDNGVEHAINISVIDEEMFEMLEEFGLDLDALGITADELADLNFSDIMDIMDSDEFIDDLVEGMTTMFRMFGIEDDAFEAENTQVNGAGATKVTFGGNIFGTDLDVIMYLIYGEKLTVAMLAAEDGEISLADEFEDMLKTLEV